MVKVETLAWHTGQGNHYEIGDVYELEERDADNVVSQGKARRLDDGTAPAGNPSQPVEPMTTENFTGKRKK